MQSRFTVLDGAILVLYFIVVMGIGFYFYRRSRSSEGYTAAARNMPGWVCGLSIFATYLSSITFLALPGKAFASNWNAFVFSLGIPVAIWIAAVFFAPYYRRTGDISAYAHLEHRFGPWARMYASSFFLLTQLARAGAVLYLMGLPLNIMLGWDIKLVILVTGISVTLYSLVGGIVAVIWTDAIQAVILIGGAVACSLIMLFNMPEGPAQTFAIAAQFDKFSLGSFGASLKESTFWVVFVYSLAINLQNFGVDQGIVQRYIAAESLSAARRSIWLGGLLYVPVSAVFFLIGTQLFAFYHVHPDKLEQIRYITAEQHVAQQGIKPDTAEYDEIVRKTALELTTEDIGDKVFPHFIGNGLPTPMIGLVIAAIFAAGMSTVSTSLNSSATLIVMDWYKRYLRPNASERETMLSLYTATLVWGLFGIAVALLMIRVTSALDAWWTLSGIFGGGMLGLFLLGMISRKADNPAAVAATLLGIGVICWMTLSSKIAALPPVLQSHLHAFLIPVFGTLTILLAGLAIARFKGKTVSSERHR